MLRLDLRRLLALGFAWGFAISIGLPCVAQNATAKSPQRAVKRNFDFAGTHRNYLLYRPTSLGRTNPVPLVVMLHGRHDSAKYSEKTYHWNDVADAHGFIVAYPNGEHRTWNAGHCCGRAQKDNVDDVGFLTALVQQLVKDENINPKQIYVAGMSNGGLMAYRMACESLLQMAGIGPVSGTRVTECPVPHPVSVIEIHGAKDRLVPLDGRAAQGDPDYIPSVNDTLSIWRVADRCDDAHITVTGEVTETVNQCDAGRAVELITIADAGHQWPEGKPHVGVVYKVTKLDEPSQRLNATERLWEFFAAHPLQ